MLENSTRAVAMARDTHLQFAGGALTPAVAKLYSQHTRISAGRPGLNLWRHDEAGERFADAAQLIDAALLKKEAGDDDWHLGMRRAGEILEWLTHPQFELHGASTRLLAAAAYQLAGYPAMAASLLDRTPPPEYETKLLPPLLKANFVELLSVLLTFWEGDDLDHLLAGGPGLSRYNGAEELDMEALLLRQIASGLGVLCSEARWGQEKRFEGALTQLDNTANFFLHSGDTHSWLLSKLVAETARSLKTRFLRSHLNPIQSRLGPDGERALELYSRYAYLEHRSIIWPSQMLGLARLGADESFALCTPTGSGKTTVAEVALLQSLFRDSQLGQDTIEGPNGSPLGMYLVPSKALAAEAESKLNRILTRVSSEEDRITVTGLYGGTDWGPTDAWLTREGKTVLICTYEKAEAILRFLGPLFLNRLRLVVIDEAHAVEFNGRHEELQKGESRSLRLEALGSRLFSHISRNNTKVIALSAVAGGIDNTLASWVRGQASEADSINYRSTRQLIGRLECLSNRRFEIRYDLLDGSSLRFSERGESDTPYIGDPFPPYPTAPQLEKGGPEKRLRPYLFWAAVHLVKLAATGENATVLVFVPQQIGGYAQDLLSLLEGDWSDVDLPLFFEPPIDGEKASLWERCLDSCSDYFTSDSREYRLLKRGIVVHHGRMPRLLSRLLVEVIEQRIVNLVLSTSTLAEGINLPFEVLLIPSLRRGQTDVPVREFKNLAGRTGRPGVATEGRTLVLLPNPPTDFSSRQAHERYYKTIGSLSVDTNESERGYVGSSPLAELLTQLKRHWEDLSTTSNLNFFDWLERTQPLLEGSDTNPAVESLDVLDSVLLSAIVELEQLAQNAMEPAELEQRLKEIWQRTYAYYSSAQQSELSSIFVRRGKALSEIIYSEIEHRRRLYKTSMPPRSASRLMELYANTRTQLLSGNSYAAWSKDDQFQFVKALVELVRSHPSFSTRETMGTRKNAPRWDQVLQWWLHPKACERSPDPATVSDWYNFVYQGFDYRFNWGLSSILSLALDEVTGGSLQPLTLDEWPETGLPWIAFWVKELIVWGTLDPAVAFLLSKRIAWTRSEAEELVKEYYDNGPVTDPNDYLNPSRILEWTEEHFPATRPRNPSRPPFSYEVELLRDFSRAAGAEWRVVPMEMDQRLVWLDPAGYPLASSTIPGNWSGENSDLYDFLLFNEERVVRASSFV